MRAVARVDEFGDNRQRVCRIGDFEILVLRLGAEFYAIENRCSHMAKPLAGGRLTGHVFVCPFHSAQFDVRTGKSMGFPAVRPLRRFDTRVEAGVIWVGDMPSAS